MTKVVLDNNITVSSIFWKKGNIKEIVDKAINREIKNLTSEAIIDELEDVLHRKFSHPPEIIKREVELLKGYSDIVEPKQKLKVVKDDPDDDKIIEAAVEGKADYIITYDNHLLKLKEFRGIKIVSPKEFLDILNQK